MLSWIDICNSALLLVGGSSINRLDEPSQEARSCKAFLDQTRTSVLVAHPWNCAIEWVTPAFIGEAGVGGNPLWPYRHAFAVPNRCLRVLRLESVPGAHPEPFFVGRFKERSILCCNLPSPTVVQISDMEDPGRISPKVRDVIVYALASKLARHLADSTPLAALYEEKYRMALQEAMLVNARE